MLEIVMQQIDRFISGLRRGTVLATVLLLILLLGLLDYSSGFEITFSFFYLIPIALATWYLSKREGEVSVALSILTWGISNRLAGETYSVEGIRYWNGGVRLLVFILFVELLHGLKVAIQNEKALSRTDFLTGISNRREFYERTGLEILRAQRTGDPMTVAYMDVDSFKQVNDPFGHSEGDKLLKEIAQTASALIRKTDIFARLGGDEFAICFPTTGESEAQCALEKVKSALDKHMCESGYPVSFSIGAVTFISPPHSTDELLNKADQLMYEVKENRKGQIAYRTIE